MNGSGQKSSLPSSQRRPSTDEPVFISPPSDAVYLYVLQEEGNGERNPIYMIGNPDIIKIGIADTYENLLSRIQKAMERGSKICPMRIRGIIRAKPSDESYLKNRWAYATRQGKVRHRRVGQGEWFDLSKDPDGHIEKWVEWFSTLGYVASSPMLARRLPFVVNSMCWLPPLGGSGGVELEDVFFSVSRPENNGNFNPPAKYVLAIRKALNGIDLAICSGEIANIGDGKHLGIGARRWFGPEGIDKVWRARSLLVCPEFSNWSMYGGRLIRALQKGDVEEACLIMTASAGTNEECYPLMQACAAIMYSKGRKNMWGGKTSQSPDGHNILYFGPNRERFRKACEHLGTLFFTP